MVRAWCRRTVVPKGWCSEASGIARHAARERGVLEVRCWDNLCSTTPSPLFLARRLVGSEV